MTCQRRAMTKARPTALSKQFSVSLVLPLLCCVSLASKKVRAEEISQEYQTVVEFESVPIEEGSDDLLVKPFIVENDLPPFVQKNEAISAAENQTVALGVGNDVIVEDDEEGVSEVRPSSAFVQDAEGRVVVGVMTDDVPTDVLKRARDHFRALFGGSLSEGNWVDPRFEGSLASAVEPRAVFSEETRDLGLNVARVVESAEALAYDKTYTVQDGKIVEVASYDLPTPTKTSFGRNWIVSYEQDANALAQSPTKNNSAKQVPSSFLLSDAAAGSGHSTAHRVNLRGHVTLVGGGQAKNVFVRIGGTGWQVHPEDDGSFEFQDVPRGSKVELVVWDVDNIFTRRIVPVAIHDDGIDVEIELQKNAAIDVVAGSYGIKQLVTQSGFCGQVVAHSQNELKGGKVSVVSSGFEGPYFYNEAHFPDLKQHELSADGRFCIFNATAKNVRFVVTLLNGERRTFQTNLYPSTFEHNLVFDMDASIFKPVRGYELVDTNESIEATGRNEFPHLGIGAGKAWITGADSPVWTRVTEFLLDEDRAYTPKFVMDDNKDELVYLPLGQSFVEVGWFSNQNGARGYQLLSRDEIAGQGALNLHGTVRDDAHPLNLKMIDPESYSELDQVASEAGIDRELGLAFVNLDLAAIQASYDDVRLSLRNVWTGETVSRFQFIPVPQGVQSPRYVRGFFPNLADGDYVLVVSSRDQVLKWLDVVRAHSGQMQVLSPRE